MTQAQTGRPQFNLEWVISAGGLVQRTLARELQHHANNVFGNGREGGENMREPQCKWTSPIASKLVAATYVCKNFTRKCTISTDPNIVVGHPGQIHPELHGISTQCEQHNCMHRSRPRKCLHCRGPQPRVESTASNGLMTASLRLTFETLSLF